MAKWEGKIVNLLEESVPVLEELNKLGDGGWELVCIIHDANSKLFRAEAGHSDYYAFFKQLKSS